MDEEWVTYGYEQCLDALGRLEKMHHFSPEQETYNNLCTIVVYLYEKDKEQQRISNTRRNNTVLKLL